MNSLFIIAEIGINANGSVDDALKLIDMAKDCGCDAVKFQKRDIETVYTKEFLDSPRESPWGTTQRQQKEGLEFGKTEYDEIDRYCKKVGIIWFASAWDLKSLEFLRQYDLKFNKIASAMLTNLDFVTEVAKEGKHTFISTGMCELVDIDRTVDIFNYFKTPFTLLHCMSVYPCEDYDCNILMIPKLKRVYGCDVGYSNHSSGILSASLAVALGASVIEVHITLNRSSYGSDQSSSLEKRGLELLIRDCKSVAKMMGDGNKIFSDKERAVAKKLK